MDEHVRIACFRALDVLCAEFGDDVPVAGGLDRGFAFQGVRVPFLNRMKGIHRAAVQEGPAALSIQTSAASPYADAETEDGFVYAYRDGPVDQPDNRALRAACAMQVPIVYFIGTRPGRYKPVYPCFVTGDDPNARAVFVSVGRMVGPLDDQEPALPDDPIERVYALRQTRVRVHQARFRARVIPAYRERCAICRLKEPSLLDAAHIVGDPEIGGVPTISNGLSLCSIHHRAFDHDLVGVTPYYSVEVSRKLLEEEDGPMLDLLKGFHGQAIDVPVRRDWRPDRERLGERFERFLERSAA